LLVVLQEAMMVRQEVELVVFFKIIVFQFVVELL
jgi:hypothetical protein